MPRHGEAFVTQFAAVDIIRLLSVEYTSLACKEGTSMNDKVNRTVRWQHTFVLDLASDNLAALIYLTSQTKTRFESRCYDDPIFRMVKHYNDGLVKLS